MKILTGCSGVGAGFELSCIKRGLSLRQFIECDRCCQKILSLRYPGVPLFPRMQTFRGYKHEFDICCFSPPCQPFSIAGHRQGRADERDCFPDVLRIINDVRPKYFAIENVPGLLSCPFRPGHESGSYWSILSGAIAELGYKLEALKCSSGAFGSPWIRERLLLVAVSRSLVFTTRTPESWKYQARRMVEEAKDSTRRGGIKSPITRSRIRVACGLDIPVGVPSRNGIIRERRAALGNALDPRVAQVAIDRILYWNSLIK
ncbi:MAG: DNA cytosine methyltransferase [Roseofilum sp. SID3]|uniref:DNA cytosine methyltransferase n=1 Tax=Roseofilum sp. SID3 TaxID=2821499 RepID=UPI001B161965|nr:DNA cytosine methyltransferase [Roseofilum sp. SID3]